MSVSFEKTGIVRASGGEINKNLLNNTSFDKKSTVTAWDTSKNGNYVATYWNGYNAGVTNQATVYHAHLTQFQGEWVYEYIRTADETWLGVSQGGLQSVIQPNTTYTWSIDEYRPTGSNNYITAGLYYKKTSDGTNNFWVGCPHGEGSDDRDRWVRRTFTFTTGEVYTGTYVTMYIYGHSGGNGTIYMRRPKLEIGDKATPWMLSDSEIFSEKNLVTGLSAGGRTTVSGSTVTALLSQNQDTYFYFLCSEDLKVGQSYTLSMDCTGFLEDANYLDCGVISQNSGKDIRLKNGHCLLTFSPDSDIAAGTRIIVDDRSRTTAGTLHDLQLTNIKLIKENTHVHGFIETGNMMRVHQNNIETTEFIEW